MTEPTTIFQAVFQNSPVGLVIVNPDTTVRDANRYMLKSFHLTPEALSGERFGNVFNCSDILEEQEVCGNGDACKTCPLRSALETVLQTGTVITDAEVDHNFHIDGVTHQKWFVVSATRVVSDGDVFAIVAFADITAQKEYEQLLNSQLSLDLATGITNKYALLNALKNLSVSKENITLAMIDFDDFKLINDTLGHLAGDKVLCIFSECAASLTRKQDILGRFGGEEFMLVMPGQSSELMLETLLNISKTLQDRCEKELHIRPTFSAGVTEVLLDADGELDVWAVISQADTNLYEAKKRGKKKVVFDGGEFPL
ncbi:GGDEF domain-containing protein [Oscillospiraceae bacterium CM]|nr:GGDEF domain-containing protein [Oscillospiraceae bacterium CM]